MIGLLIKLLRGRATLLKTTFALYVLGITVWVGAIFLNTFLMNTVIAKIVFSSAIFFLTAQLWFTKFFLSEPGTRPPYDYWSIVLGGMLMVLSFLDGALFSTITFHQDGYVIVENGFLSVTYLLFVLTCTAGPLIILGRKYRKITNPQHRVQTKYLIIGFAAFLFISVLTNSVLPVFFNIYFFNAIGPIFSIFMAISIFFIIWRHQFLDIRIVIQRGFIYTSLLTLLIGVYFSILFSIQYSASVTSNITTPLSALVVMLIGVFTVPPLERYFRKKTDVWFFKDRYNYSEALQELSDILNTHNTPGPLIEKICSALEKILRVHEVTFLPPEASDNGDTLCFPITSKQHKIGTLSLGTKRSGDAYTNEDMNLLRTLSSGFAVALQKAELFEEVRQHSRQLEQRVADRTHHLRELQENQKRMISDISHALQTPLTVLKGTIQRIVESPTKVPKHAHMMEESINNISTFVYDLLHLSRLDTLPKTSYTYFNASELVVHIAEYVRTICDEDHITLLTDVEKEIMMMGNEKEITELITILLSNAVKYTRDVPIMKITARVHKDGEDVVFSVTDTGIGIPADKLQYIFERFYRAHEGMSARGSGLGLAIAKRIVENHAGDISVKSVAGQGSTFIVRIPCVHVTTQKITV